MVSIRTHNLHWLEGLPPEQDLCAHGGFVVSHGDALVLDERDESWCLSAAALHLLGTLSSDHGEECRVGEHLFPHC